ncbi:MAG: hypothetical protein GC189_07535 [Alphaproteobacteria bacterium]|nr:hypothetical protein [Alphaproteobacteria bacterium]
MSLILDPREEWGQEAFGWGQTLTHYAEAIDPSLLSVDGFRVENKTVWIDMVGHDGASRVSRALEDHDGMRRFRTRVADLGWRLTVIVEEV